MCVCVRVCVHVCASVVQERMVNVHLHSAYWWFMMCAQWINLWDSACSYMYLYTV